MKTTPIFSDSIFGYYLSQHSEGGRKQIDSIFCYTKGDGGFLRAIYYKTKKRSTRTESRKQIYFVPNELADPKLIKAEFTRAMQFFSAKDGMLWGAYYELTKLGKFVEINV